MDRVFAFVQVNDSRGFLDDDIPAEEGAGCSHELRQDGVCGKHIADLLDGEFFKHWIVGSRDGVKHAVVDALENLGCTHSDFVVGLIVLVKMTAPQEILRHGHVRLKLEQLL